jgi:hypothetical protein
MNLERKTHKNVLKKKEKRKKREDKLTTSTNMEVVISSFFQICSLKVLTPKAPCVKLEILEKKVVILV